MIKITSQEIDYLAKISRIKINPHEAEKLAGEIAAVLAYASSLQSVAQAYQSTLANVQESLKPELCKNVTREDSIVHGDVQAILAQASEREGDYFVVPRIIKQD